MSSKYQYLRLSRWYNWFLNKFQLPSKNRQALIQLLRDVSFKQLLDHDLSKMVENVLCISDIQVRDIMVARSQMIVLEKDQSFQDALPIMISSAHSRFPVIDSNKDTEKVIGILLAKDLLRFCFTDIGKEEKLSIQDLTHKAFFVPESKRLDALLKQFRLTYNHMAIVVDEYNNLAGLVTIEDVLEQIVGSIEDEHYVESKEKYIRHLNRNEFIVQALTPIEYFNRYFQSALDEKNLDTIGGLVAQHLGRLPKVGEIIQLDHIQFVVLNANKRKIKSLKVIPG